MRKDTHQGYHPGSNNTSLSSYGKGIHRRSTKTDKPRIHNCIICRHIECEQINRKILEGWRYVDIIKQHPWIRSHTSLQGHVYCLGLKDDLAKIREIKLKKILEDIIRAGLPLLDDGKVYPRDMIEAAKALNDLEKRGDVKRIWEMVEFSAHNDTQNGHQENNPTDKTLQSTGRFD